MPAAPAVIAQGCSDACTRAAAVPGYRQQGARELPLTCPSLPVPGEARRRCAGAWSCAGVCWLHGSESAHRHFSVQVDRGGVAKFVSKANAFLPLQVLAMLNSMYPAEKKFLCRVSSSQTDVLRRLVIFFNLLMSFKLWKAKKVEGDLGRH